MREIIFRGKRVDNGEWYYGYLLQPNIISNVVSGQLQYADLFVDENTVGQYTGLKDKNGKKIFEGDIITCINTTRQGYIIGQKMCGFIEYEQYGCYWFCKNNFQHYNDWVYADDIEVIGNIHDNPELLK